MRTKKFAVKCKRVLAVVLAFAMMLTTFVDGSFVSKASNETLPYVGEVYDNELDISFNQMENGISTDREKLLLR